MDGEWSEKNTLGDSGAVIAGLCVALDADHQCDV